MIRRLRNLDFPEYLRVGVRTYREKILLQASFWSAAALVGVATVYFTRLITLIQDIYSAQFAAHPWLMSVFTPLAFLAAAAVVRLAPYAGGSGVPQVLYAVELARHGSESPVRLGMISLRTAAVKVVSTALGFLGGASIGGEGPTVQVAASIFGSIGHRMRELLPQLDLQSYIVAGGGAGIAAAFNTPLGGVAFAIEEVSMGDFGPLRHLVILAVIVTGMAVQAFVGDELYFGNPGLTGGTIGRLPAAILVGAAGGLLGGLFGKLASSTLLERSKLKWWWKALLCGALVTAINLWFGGRTGGSGYALTRSMMVGTSPDVPLSFPLAKLVATALSTLSGMGGGILAPSLSIGSWMGVTVAKIASLHEVRACALLGMVAYFSGAFQIPITSVIVVMEMTDEHDVIFPMLVAALCAHLVARIIMPVSLYHLMIDRLAGRNPSSRSNARAEL